MKVIINMCNYKENVVFIAESCLFTLPHSIAIFLLLQFVYIIIGPIYIPFAEYLITRSLRRFLLPTFNFLHIIL